MKQITPEIKAKIFALYLSNQVYVESMPDADLLLHGVSLEDIGYGVSAISEYRTELTKPHLFDLHDCKLWLRNLSSITDEDAIQLCRILKYKEDDYFVNSFGISAHVYLVGHIENDKNGFLGYVVTESGRVLEAADFLRSKGYALPAFGYSVDELIEAGVFKIKEVNND